MGSSAGSFFLFFRRYILLQNRSKVKCTRGSFWKRGQLAVKDSSSLWMGGNRWHNSWCPFFIERCVILTFQYESRLPSDLYSNTGWFFNTAEGRWMAKCPAPLKQNLSQNLFTVDNILVHIQIQHPIMSSDSRLIKEGWILILGMKEDRWKSHHQHNSQQAQVQC